MALNAQLNRPTGVAIDSNGNIYIADSGNERIRKIDVTTNIITTVAGTGSAGYNGDEILAASAQLNSPHGLTTDASGNIYIADQLNNRVRKVTISTGLISTVAGNGDFFHYAEGGLAINTPLKKPEAVAVDAIGDLYIADYYNSRIRKVSISSGVISLVAGNGTNNLSGDGGLATDASLKAPTSISLDAVGNIYIADFGNNALRKIDAVSGIISTIAGNGGIAFCCDGGQATDAQLAGGLNGVAIDKQGNLFISDTGNYRIRKVDSNGIINTFAGNGHLGFDIPVEGGFAINERIVPTTGIAVDEFNVYFSEPYRIRKVEKTTGRMTTLAGTGVGGFSGDGGLATSAKIDINGQAGGIKLDTHGNVYFVDTSNGRIRRIDSVTGIINTVAGGGIGMDGSSALSAVLIEPHDIAFDLVGNMYISEEYRVRKVDAASGVITTIAGDGTGGFMGDGGPSIHSKLWWVYGIAVNSDGEIYISDGANGRIRKIDKYGIINTVAGNGQYGSDGDGGLAIYATLRFPGGISIDEQDNVYVADFLGIRKIQNTNLDQSITFNSLAPKTFGDAFFTLSATTTSNLPISYTSSDETIATISDNKVTINRAGSTIITAKQPGNTKYSAAADVTQVLTIIKANQTVIFNPIAAKGFGDDSFTLTANTTSGLPVSYSSSDETIATISDSIVSIIGAGSAIITAKQAGDTNYSAAADVTQVLNVSKANQTIIFESLPAKIFGDAPFNLTATSSSALSIQYSSSSDEVSLLANQVTIIKPGSVTIKADQHGDNNFNEATSVSQSFCVNPQKPGINVTGLNSGSPVLTSSSSSGNQWFKNGTLIADEISNTLSPTEGGSYSVNVTVDNCTSEQSTEQILLITGDVKSTFISSGFLVYPNPVKDDLTINLTAFNLSSEVKIIIYDISGKEVEKMFRKGEKTTLSVRSYSPGIYFITASQQNLIYEAKFVRE